MPCASEPRSEEEERGPAQGLNSFVGRRRPVRRSFSAISLAATMVGLTYAQKKPKSSR